jgi:hypothetical protein
MPPAHAIQAFTATRITTAVTTHVKVGTGVVHRIVIAGGTLGTITLNDKLGTLLVFDATAPRGSYELNITCAGLIDIVTGAATDVTIVWA